MTDATSPTPGGNRENKAVGGHWLLARAGKKVLRPGGRVMTNWIIDRLPIHEHDVVEFAPGLGITAKELLARTPKSYCGIDADPNAAQMASASIALSDTVQIKEGTAEHTGLPDNCADVVIGEAMLTMNTDEHKLNILKEAYRLLRAGGKYGIHELALVPDDIPAERANALRKELAQVIKVNARPLTGKEWSALAQQAGFEVVATHFEPMALLQPKRVIDDEGVKGALRIIFNVLRQKDIRTRVLAMRKTFSANRDVLAGIGLVLKKPETA